MLVLFAMVCIFHTRTNRFFCAFLHAAFVAYLGVPTVAMIVALFSRRSDWWELTLTAWFASVLIFYGFFLTCELWLELWACLELVEEEDGSSLIDGDPWNARVLYWFRLAIRVALRTVRYRLSGKVVHFKKLKGDRTTAIMDNKCVNFIKEGPYSYIANKVWNPCFEQKAPERIHTLEETLGEFRCCACPAVRSFHTSKIPTSPYYFLPQRRKSTFFDAQFVESGETILQRGDDRERKLNTHHAGRIQHQGRTDQ